MTCLCAANPVGATSERTFCTSGDSLAIVTICVNCSVPTKQVGLKDLNRYVYPSGKAADYDHLRQMVTSSVFNMLQNYLVS